MHSMKTEEIDNPEITKKKIVSLLKGAKNEVWMSTGLNSSFYNDTEVKDSMLAAFNKANHIKLLIDAEASARKIEIPWIFSLKESLKSKMEIRQHKNILHWLIVDGKNCRLEQTHPIGEVGIKNLLVYDIPSPIMDDIKRVYNKWWNEGKPIDP